MKVMFFLQNFYICYEPFQRVVAQLRNMGIDAYYTYIDYINKYGFERIIDEHKITNHLVKLPIQDIIRPKENFFVNLLRSPKFMIDQYNLKRFVCTNKPDMVVVLLDVGDFYARLLMDICKTLGIKVLILAFIPIASKFINPAPDKGIPYTPIIRFLSRLLGFENTIFFRSWVIGSYHQEAIIAVPDNGSRELLVNNGISGQRIAVTGSPSDDRLYELLSQPVDQIKTELCDSLECSKNSWLIVYCTELIQQIHGDDYLYEINSILKEAFDSLPVDCRVIIKLHPREPLEMAAYYEKLFNSGRYKIFFDIDLFKLLRAADLMIGHYTIVIRDAALLETPVLSIRLIDDRTVPNRFGRISEFAHITSKSEVETKIKQVLLDKTFVEKQKRFIRQWREESGYIIDGKSSQRIASLIKKVLDHNSLYPT